MGPLQLRKKNCYDSHFFNSNFNNQCHIGGVGGEGGFHFLLLKNYMVKIEGSKYQNLGKN